MPLSDDGFFETLGRDDLAEEHRRNVRTGRTLSVLGGVVFVAGLAMEVTALTKLEQVGANDPRCPLFLDDVAAHEACAGEIEAAGKRQAGRWALAGAITMVGGGSIAIVGAVKRRKRVVSETSAYEMAEDYNQKLRERLGSQQALRSAPLVKALAISPSYDPYTGSAGVALAGAF